MKHTFKFFQILFGFITLIAVINWEKIYSNFMKDPGNYLIEIVCMLIPLFVSFYLFYAESRNEEKNEDDRRKYEEKQQRINSKVLKYLNKEIKQQQDLNSSIRNIIEKIRKITRPQELAFIIKNYNKLKTVLDYTKIAGSYGAVPVRIHFLLEIYKEITEIDDDDIRFQDIEKFDNLKLFLRQYISWLDISTAVYNGLNKDQRVSVSETSILTFIATNLMMCKSYNSDQIENIYNNLHCQVKVVLNIYSAFFLKTNYIDFFRDCKDERQAEKKLKQEFNRAYTTVTTIYNSKTNSI